MGIVQAYKLPRAVKQQRRTISLSVLYEAPAAHYPRNPAIDFSDPAFFKHQDGVFRPDRLHFPPVVSRIAAVDFFSD